MLTALSIVLGVAMISGTFVLTGQINRAFSQIFDAANVKNDVVIEVRTVSKTNGGGFPEPLPASVLATALKVPGVAAGTGEIDALGSLVTYKNGVPKRVTSTGGARRSSSRRRRPASRPGSTSAGDARPRRARSGWLKDTATKVHAQIGSTVGLVTLDGLKRLQVVGIYKIGTSASLGGALVSSIPLANAQHWFGLDGQFTQINLQADPGPSHATDAIACAPPSAAATRFRPARRRPKPTPRARRHHQRHPRSGAARVRRRRGARRGLPDLQLFSITVAQRIREIAMLRTLGASRRQVLASVMIEAFVTAAVASIAGIFVGLLIAAGIIALFGAIGVGLPSTSAAGRDEHRPRPPRRLRRHARRGPHPRRRATKIPPMAGLREGATLPRSRFARFRHIVAVLFALAGAALIANGGRAGTGPVLAADRRRRGARLPRRRHDGALRFP